MKFDFDKAVLNTLGVRRLIKAGDTVCVACSGGADSMSLLFFMHSRRDALGIDVRVANVEHGVRGEASARDSEFVAEYCAARGIKLFSFRGDAPAAAAREKLTLEEAARNVRYGFFEKLLADGAADKVALGHHLDDNAETVLFNLFRGGGARGLSGMDYARGNFIRPFLDVTRAQIADYAAKNKIPFVTDGSNSDIKHTRNFIRAEILTRLGERFGNVAENVVAAARRIGRDDDFINGLLGKGRGKKYSLSDAPALSSRLILNALREIDAAADSGERHIGIISELAEKRSGASANLPSGVTARREYGKIVLRRGARTKALAIGGAGGKKRRAGADGGKTLYLDADKLPAGISVGPPRGGEIFKPLGGGTKKLCDWFTDAKIPPARRGDIPLLSDGRAVYAVCGYEIADGVKIDAGTRRVAALKPDGTAAERARVKTLWSLGEAAVDFIMNEYEGETVYSPRPGGAALNAARFAALAAKGAGLTDFRSVPVVRIGRDDSGEFLLGAAAEAGCDTRLMKKCDADTTRLKLRIYADGRQACLGREGNADLSLAARDVGRIEFIPGDVLYITSDGFLSASGARAHKLAVRRAAAAGAKIVFDLNYRAEAWERGDFRKTALPFVSAADFLKIKEEELPALFLSANGGFDSYLGELSKAVKPRARLFVTRFDLAVEEYEGGRILSRARPEKIDPVHGFGRGDKFTADVIIRYFSGKL